MQVPRYPGPPDPIAIEKLNRTEFVPTLENKISENKNVVYCPSLLYAWNIIKKTFKDSICLKSFSSADFKLLNESRSFRNALEDSENMSEADFSEGAVSIRSFFSKKMPYQSAMQKLTEGLVFEKTKISTFGMNGMDRSLIDFTHIMYYDDDKHFVIKITPQDTSNEILLIKGLKGIQSLAEALSQTQQLLVRGQKDSLNIRNSWKYAITMKDTLAIPIIEFNVAAHFKTIEGQSFLNNNHSYTVKKAYQKTAFKIDQNGCAVENTAEIAYAALDSVGVAKSIHPKHLYFNEPFYIIIRHPHRNPYFVMKVQNTELLKKL